MTQPEKNDFQSFHDEMRRLNRRGWRRRDTGTYVREKIEGKPKGKKAIRAAKRERVRQMKEASNVS